MSIIGALIRDGRLVRNLRPEQVNPAVESKSPTNTPYLLLWSAGIIAFVLGMVGFMLWGINGAGTLFDMAAAFCA
jgi:hypothetical protein